MSIQLFQKQYELAYIQAQQPSQNIAFKDMVTLTDQQKSIRNTIQSTLMVNNLQRKNQLFEIIKNYPLSLLFKIYYNLSKDMRDRLIDSSFNQYWQNRAEYVLFSPLLNSSSSSIFMRCLSIYLLLIARESNNNLENTPETERILCEARICGFISINNTRNNEQNTIAYTAAQAA